MYIEEAALARGVKMSLAEDSRSMDVKRERGKERERERERKRERERERASRGKL